MDSQAQDSLESAAPLEWSAHDTGGAQSGSPQPASGPHSPQTDALGDAQPRDPYKAEHGLAVQDTPRARGPASLDAVLGVPVKVQAVLGRTRMPIDDLLQLSPGTVVELDRKVGEPVDIFVNDRLIARGEVVMIENALGVTLTEIVREE